ncbi:MAG TPA: AarF/ABC1/UbiB kinase family protein, partial [Epsilonproteobacteria bacterium]|nr:AarF/ABC1/UbiB kinase family protein [Campylobacterota bacterium]
MKRLSYYSPKRVYLVFLFLLSVYLIIKGKSHFLGLRPLSPNALKESVIKLGASFVKLAQVLATRADFFPTEYLDQLKELHDKLPPMNQDSFDTVYSRAFGTKSPFERIEQKPIASASIGQVHAAFLPDGTKVAVKLRRLGIKEQVKADITIIETLNTIFRPLFSKYTKNSIEAVLKE